MTHTTDQNGSFFTNRQVPPLGTINETAAAGASQSHLLQAALLMLLSVVLAGVLFAPGMVRAEPESLPQVATLPSVTETLKLSAKVKQRNQKHDALLVRGVCSDGIAVFTVKNTSKRWATRGHLRIYDATTAKLVRQRWLRFGDGQSASFRIGPDQVPGHRYRVTVTLPNGSLSAVKNFRGRCPQPGGEVREARR